MEIRQFVVDIGQIRKSVFKANWLYDGLCI